MSASLSFPLVCKPCATHLLICTSSSGANFENAYVADVLMDRAVMVDANLRNANFERTVSHDSVDSCSSVM
jgi:uncharacterized protein YjbI with pentapeptide repeats